MDNSIGIFYTYYAFEQQVEWEKSIRRAALAGADCIEISAMRLVREPESVCDRILQTARECGIALNFTSGLPEGCDSSSEDERERRRSVAFVEKNIKLVSKMGGQKLGAVFHGRNHPHENSFGKKERRLEWAAQSVKQMGRIAEDYGISLSDEAVNRFESDMINTVDEELAFLERVDCPSVKALLDTFHMNIEEDDLTAAISRAGKQIGHVHLSENNRKLPGNGHLEWLAILNALSEAQYTGLLTMESFTTPYPAISDSMCIWRNMAKTGMDEDVREAVMFLKTQMKRVEIGPKGKI